MTSAFDAETAVEPAGDGTWSAFVSDRWNIGDSPNGGYLLATALQALRGLGPHPDPITVTAHFLRPGAAGVAADVTAALVRSGRTLTTGRATLSQQGKARLEVIAGYSDLDAPSGIDASLSIGPPDMPQPDDCNVRSAEQQGVTLDLLSRLDIRIHPEQWQAGQVGAADVSGWIRFADGRPPDSHALVLFADAFPPSLFGLLDRIGWVPTIELTVHVRRRPAPGWILGRFTTSDLHNGRMVEDGSLWDESGALVARSRQVGLVLAS